MMASLNKLALQLRQHKLTFNLCTFAHSCKKIERFSYLVPIFPWSFFALTGEGKLSNMSDNIYSLSPYLQLLISSESERDVLGEVEVAKFLFIELFMFLYKLSAFSRCPWSGSAVFHAQSLGDCTAFEPCNLDHGRDTMNYHLSWKNWS